MPTTSLKLADLIVTLAVVLALMGIMIGERNRLRSADSIVGCADNLRQIAQGLVQYGLAHDGQFPRTRYDPAAPITAYTGRTSADPFVTTGPAANDVTSAAFLIAREVSLPAETFICPAADRNGLSEADPFDGKSVLQFSNFRARVGYNYSLTNMYPSLSAVKRGYSLDRFLSTRPADFAIGGDTNPGRQHQLDVANTPAATPLQRRLANSPNHEREGQNVLYADGGVRFVHSPLTGVAGENIYDSTADTYPSPTDADDAVLLPTWETGDKITPVELTAKRWVFSTAMVAVTIGLVWLLYRFRNRPNARPIAVPPEPGPM